MEIKRRLKGATEIEINERGESGDSDSAGQVYPPLSGTASVGEFSPSRKVRATANQDLLVTTDKEQSPAARTVRLSFEGA
jgi:hypothetical protein